MKLLTKKHNKGRSSKWSKFRKKFLKKHPFCEACGRKSNVTPHHIKPFHLFPEDELKESNLIGLCERPKVLNCHIIWGHSGNFRSYNPRVWGDVIAFKDRIETRP